MSGYKKTDIGTFPCDWAILQIGSLANVEGGYAFSSKAFLSSGIYQVIKMSNLHGGVLDLERSGSFLNILTERERQYLLCPNQIMLTLTGTTGKRDYGYSYVVKYEQNLLLNQRVARVVVSEKFCPSYIHLQLQSPCFLNQFFEVSKGGTGNQTNVGTQDVAAMQIPVPPLPEQLAIAETLGDVDALLRSLDRLIAKKRDLKQAAMQQLLTGQTRLPGFSGNWEVKRLKSVAEISTGINKPLSEMGSGTLYVTVQDLYDKTSIRTERLSRIKVTQSEIDTRSLLVGDIVFGKSSVKRDGIGYPSQFLGCNEAVIFSGFTYRARAQKGITDPTFLFYALREDRTRRWLIDNSQASALTNINQSIADAIPVQLPPTISEQIAIGSALMEMDCELTELEQRRNKTKVIKQGMMQELLTGRTRLV